MSTVITLNRYEVQPVWFPFVLSEGASGATPQIRIGDGDWVDLEPDTDYEPDPVVEGDPSWWKVVIAGDLAASPGSAIVVNGFERVLLSVTVGSQRDIQPDPPQNIWFQVVE